MLMLMLVQIAHAHADARANGSCLWLCSCKWLMLMVMLVQIAHAHARAHRSDGRVHAVAGESVFTIYGKAGGTYTLAWYPRVIVPSSSQRRGLLSRMQVYFEVLSDNPFYLFFHSNINNLV
jgi:hypothetical protein